MVFKINKDVELLNFIYQNSEMGVDTINKLIGIAEDKHLKKHLKSQFQEYKKINEKAKLLLNENGYDEKGITALKKLRTYLMINIQTLTDKSASHISEMLIIGSNMGIINALKSIKEYKDANPKIIKLMKKLLETEEKNVEELKSFL